MTETPSLQVKRSNSLELTITIWIATGFLKHRNETNAIRYCYVAMLLAMMTCENCFAMTQINVNLL